MCASCHCRERFVDNCVLELQGGSVKVHLSQAPSASCTGMGGQARSGGAKGGKRAVTTAAERDSDPALTGTTVWDGGVVLSQALTCTDWLQRHREGQPWPSGGARPHCLEVRHQTATCAFLAQGNTMRSLSSHSLCIISDCHFSPSTSPACFLITAAWSWHRCRWTVASSLPPGVLSHHHRHPGDAPPH